MKKKKTDKQSGEQRDSPRAEAAGQCPSRAEWSGFHLGAHSNDRIESLYEHLQSCDACASVLDSLARETVNNSIVDALLTPEPGDSLLNESAFKRLRAKIVSSSDRDEATESGPARPEEHVAFTTPSRLGRFDIVRVIGTGGFGVVYLANDPHLKRQVALKIPRDHALMAPELRRRFVWEGQAAARIQHPNVLPLFEANECDGIPYIASEYCGGRPLAEILKEGPRFPATESAKLILRLADAVQHAHSRGILHRDIKPSNILMDHGEDHGVHAVDGSYLVPKLVDFGLAKPLAADSGDSVRETTKTGLILGTPAYMAPEQINGVADVRSDIYSLGVILYELLAGRKPFPATSFVEVLKAMERGDRPPTPSSLRSGVPHDLETICLKCLRVNPDQRYASAAQLVGDLKRFSAGEPIHARPVGPVEKTFLWTKRHPARALLLVMAMIAPLIIITAMALHNRQLERALTRAETSESIARQHLYAADIRQAFQAWEGAQLEQFQEHLDKYAHSTMMASNVEDPRGMEWFFLSDLGSLFSNESVRQAHHGSICCVRFSPRGDLLATSSTDGLVKLWNVATQELQHVLRGHDKDVNKIDFSPDGKMLVSAGDDGTVRIWDVVSGELKRSFAAGDGRIFEVAYHPNGKTIVSAGDGEGIRFWRSDNGGLQKSISAKNVRALAMHPTVPYIASAGDKQPRIRVTDFESMTVFEINTPELGSIDDLDFSRDGGRLAVAARTGVARVYDVTKRIPCVPQLEGHRDAVRAIRFSPDGQWLATGSIDHTIRIWNIYGRLTKTLRGHVGEVWTLDFSPNGQLLASGDADGFLRVWYWQSRSDIGNDALIDTIGNQSASAVLFLRDSKRLIATCEDAAFQIMDRSGRSLHRFGGPVDAKRAVGLALSPNEQRVAVAETGGDICLWNVKTRQVERHFAAHKRTIWECAFSPDGRMLATCGEDSNCRLWDVSSGARLAEGPAHAKPVRSLAFSPDGKLLATTSVDGTAILWSVPSLRPIHVLIGHSDVVLDVAFSPSGRVVATCGHDRTIILWNVATGKAIRTLQGHEARVMCLAFSSDEKTLLSGDILGVIRFWQLSTGERIGALDTGLYAIRDIAISKQQSSLAVLLQSATREKGTLVLWTFDRNGQGD